MGRGIVILGAGKSDAIECSPRQAIIREAAQALCASGWTHAIPAFAAHREAAEKAERDRICAWIRAGGANVIVETHPAYLRDLAGAIERGEHLK